MQVAADIEGSQLIARSTAHRHTKRGWRGGTGGIDLVIPELVYECFWDNNADCWVPVSVRWDKGHGNSPTSFSSLEAQARGEGLRHAQLLSIIRSTQATEAAAADPAETPPAGSPTKHLARSFHFNKLYARIMQVDFCQFR
jgi:hypothetical protein